MQATDPPRLQEQEGDQAGALQTLRAALQWWRESMVDAPSGGENPEHWLLRVRFQGSQHLLWLWRRLCRCCHLRMAAQCRMLSPLRIASAKALCGHH